MQRTKAVANWLGHVNGVNPPDALRHWLTDRVSLTVKLIAHSRHFRVQRLVQQSARCLADECDAVGLARPRSVQERDVLLVCDGKPVVFAHTIVPLQSDASDWPFFSSLGEHSLGTTLFGDPLVKRGAMQFARLPSQHPLLRRARLALGSKDQVEQALFARRRLYWRKQGVLLVTEVFLPTIAELTLRPECLARHRSIGGHAFKPVVSAKPS